MGNLEVLPLCWYFTGRRRPLDILYCNKFINLIELMLGLFSASERSLMMPGVRFGTGEVQSSIAFGFRMKEYNAHQSWRSVFFSNLTFTS